MHMRCLGGGGCECSPLPPPHPSPAPAPIEQEVLERERWAAPSAQDIVNSYRGSDVRLAADDIILQVGAGACGGACISGRGRAVSGRQARLLRVSCLIAEGSGAA